MVSLDEWLTLYAGTFIFPFPTQWFATILSATEMTKLSHNNPFLLQCMQYCYKLWCCIILWSLSLCTYTGCNAVVYVTGNSRIVVGQSYSITCNTSQASESSCIEDEFYVFNGNRLISRNKHTTLRTDSISSILNNYLNRFYSCIVTLSGSNFTSNPARLSFLIECEWLKLLLGIKGWEPQHRRLIHKCCL